MTKAFFPKDNVFTLEATKDFIYTTCLTFLTVELSQRSHHHSTVLTDSSLGYLRLAHY